MRKREFFKPRKAAGGDGAIATSDWTRDKSRLLNSLLEAAFAHLRDFCLNVAKSNVFLVDQKLEGPRRDAINQLVDLRLVHPVKSRVTLKAQSQGRLFEAYMLDLSQYSASRKVRGISLVDLGPGTNQDLMRRAGLIYGGYDPNE